MIYFIETQGMVKIGHSGNPRRRFQAIATGCPTVCTLIGVTDGGREKEAELHHKFRKHRINREWFKFDRSINSYLSENAIHVPAPVKKGPKNAPPKWNEIVAAAKACGAGEWAMRKWLERCEIPAVWKLKLMAHDKRLKLSDLEIVEAREAAE